MQMQYAPTSTLDDRPGANLIKGDSRYCAVAGVNGVHFCLKELKSVKTWEHNSNARQNPWQSVMQKLRLQI